MLGRSPARGSGAGTCRRSAQRGQVLILWILAATVIFVIGAIVIDVGLWLTERRKAQMAADFSAMAAMSVIGEPFPVVEAKAREFAERNGFKHTPGEVEVDVNTPYNGDPGMVEVTIKQGSPMLFAGIFDVGAFEIGARAVGTLGSGEAGPLDLVIILDRTTTMWQPSSDPPVDKAKSAALTALQIFDDEIQHVALGVIWASNPSSPCEYHDTGDWITVPLRRGNDYRNDDGTLNTSSELVQRINCLQISSGPGTNFRDPVASATDELLNNSPRGVGPKKAIIFLTDGEANEPRPRPCQEADEQATLAKSSDIEIYTIGFGIETERCSVDSDAPYANMRVSTFLARMATNSDDDGCSSASERDNENSDRDHFFCEAKSEDLTPIFARIAEDLTQGYRLDE
jgi:hypothetical protein